MKKLNYAQNALFNTVGNLISSGCLWLTTLLVVRLSSDYANAGVWQLSISLSGIFWGLAVFNLGGYMVTDAEHEFAVGKYIAAQIVTVSVSAVFSIGYALLCGYRGQVLASILLYTAANLVNALSSVCAAIDQIHYRMDYIGISSAVRGVIGLCLFGIVLKLTDKVYAAAAMYAAANGAVLLVYDIPKARQFCSLRPCFQWKEIGKLLIRCAPTVIAGTLMSFMTTVPRQTLQSLAGDSALGYYATVATPVVLIQTIANNLFSPLLRDMTLYYKEKRYDKIGRILKLQCAAAAGIAVPASVAVWLLGKPVMRLIYGAQIVPYCYLLYAVVVCSVLYIEVCIFSNLMLLMRKTRRQTIFAVLALGVEVLLNRFLIRKYGMNGVSFSLMFGYVCYILPMAATVFAMLKKSVE